MKQISAIALNTIKEILRNKIYFLIFIFAIFLVVLTYFLGQLTYRDEVKITIDLGLGAINIAGLLISIFLGVSLLHREIDKKSIYIVLSKPIPRYYFIIGKYLGLAAIIISNVILMGLIVVFNIFIIKGKVPIAFFQALLLMSCEMLIIVAIAIFFSTFTSVILSSMFTIGFYLIAHSSNAFHILVKKSTGLKQQVFQLAQFLLPNFENLNLKNLVLHISSVDTKVIILGLFYAFTYIIILLLLSIIIFSKKEFK